MLLPGYCHGAWGCYHYQVTSGIPLVDEEGNKLGTSIVAAQHAIPKVVESRITIAAPGMRK